MILTSAAAVAKRFEDLGKAMHKPDLEAVKAGTAEAREWMHSSGQMYHIHNRKGQRVYLGASSKVTPSSPPQGVVKGTPAGFWALIEVGRRAPKGSYIERSGARMLKNYRTVRLSVRRRKGVDVATDRYAAAPSWPMPIGGGRFAMSVRPGPSKSTGHPWEHGMARIKETIAETMASKYREALKQIAGF